MSNVPSGVSTSGFFGHPRGLMTLFFTEMWERFSYYGMRAILTLFMTTATIDGGLGFSAAQAGPIYAMYTSLVYLVTVPGGWLADNFLGQRKAILYGGIVIMIGHVLLALQGITTFYAGLGCVVIGTGLLKPNISAVVGQIYTPEDTRRDAGFSIFYMGINVGAFSAPLICGWLAQHDAFKAMLVGWGMNPAHSWHWGFGAAAVGMFFGLVQYVTTGRHLGEAGLRPAEPPTPEIGAHNRRTLQIGIGATVVAVAALLFVDSRATFLDRVEWAPSGAGITAKGQVKDDASQIMALNGGEEIGVEELDKYLGEDTAEALREVVLREEILAGRAQGEALEAYENVKLPDDSAGAEEGATLSIELRNFAWVTEDGSLHITGEDREVEGSTLDLGVYTPDELAAAFGDALASLKASITDAAVSQALEAGTASGSLAGQNVKIGGLNATNIKLGFTVLLLLVVIGFFSKLFLTGDWTPSERARLTTIFVLFLAAAVFWGIFEQAGSTLTLFADRYTHNEVFGIAFPSSWWQSLNAVLIVLLAPFFAWLWTRLGKRDLSYPAKFSIGLLFAGIGFLVLVIGSSGLVKGMRIGPSWLIMVYFFHTVGELCLSPVGLSSMTKLAPARVVGLMMGVWFLAASVGNFLAGMAAGYSEQLPQQTIFGIGAAAGGVMALVMLLLVRPIRNMLKRTQEEVAFPEA